MEGCKIFSLRLESLIFNDLQNLKIQVLLRIFRHHLFRITSSPVKSQMWCELALVEAIWCTKSTHDSIQNLATLICSVSDHFIKKEMSFRILQIRGSSMAGLFPDETAAFWRKRKCFSSLSSPPFIWHKRCHLRCVYVWRRLGNGVELKLELLG